MAACPRCGADRSAANGGPCPACGRVEITLGGAPMPARTQLVESSRRPRGRALAIGAIGALVIGGLAWSAVNSDGSEPAASPTTVAPTTFLPTTSSDANFVTVPPTVSPPTTALRRMNDATEDYFVLGEEVDYRLYVVDATNLITGYVDLNTGRYFEATIKLRNTQLHPTGDGRFFAPAATAIVDRDLTTSANIDQLVGGQGFEPGAPGRIWSRRSDRGPNAELSEIDAAGNVYARAKLPDGFGAFGWLSGTDFVLSGGGRIFLFDAKTGQARNYAIGDVSTVQSERVVWRGCEAQLRCTLYVGTSTNPTWRNLGELPYLNEDALSPDANWATVFTAGALQLRDLRTNRDRLIPYNGSPRGWTPDSRFLLLRSERGFAALEVATDRIIDLKAPVDAGTFIAI